MHLVCLKKEEKCALSERGFLFLMLSIPKPIQEKEKNFTDQVIMRTRDKVTQ